MILAFLKYQFAGLWPLLWHFGLGGIVVVGCVALYVFTPAPLAAFFPNIRKILIWVASVTVAIMISVAVGVTLGEKRVQAQWDAARAATLENAKAARTSAVRSVARKPSRWVPNHADRYDRDGQ